jgi:hypothetical protein
MWIYTSAILTPAWGAATNYAYLFGARIAKATPHLCTAKQGLRDQEDTYDFTLFGGANLANNGHFDATTGFVEDGQSTNGIYPAASDVVTGNLPTSAEVSGASVSFQSANRTSSEARF